MVSVNVSVSDDDRALVMEEIESRIENLQPALEGFGEYMLLETRSYFDSERSPQGVSWAQISPAWKARKAKQKKDRGVGKYTLALRDGITYRAGPSFVEIGSARPYAGVFQFGRRDGTQESRPFLGLTPENRRELVDGITDFISP